MEKVRERQGGREGERERGTRRERGVSALSIVSVLSESVGESIKISFSTFV